MVLDTHIWVWAAEGDSKLGSKTRRHLDKASRELRGELLVSSVSAFEITSLQIAGRIQLSASVDRWIRESISLGNLRMVDLERDIAIDAGMIPTTALPDPFDRCLVATAREYGVPLVTSDRRILDYAKRTSLVKAIDGSI